MAFTDLIVDGHPVIVPEDLASRENAEDALEALLRSASPYYNAGLEALRKKRVPKALSSAYSALRVFPYSPRFTEFGLASSIQHGDFAQAKSILQWAENTGMSAGWPNYQNALRESILDWNRFTKDPEALWDKYRSASPEVSYRELLLLADRAGKGGRLPLSEEAISLLEDYDISHAASSGSRVPSERSSSDEQDYSLLRKVAVAGVAGMVGIALGVGSASVDFGQGGSGTPEANKVNTSSSESSSTDSTLQGITRINRLLADHNFLAAERALDSLEVTQSTDDASSDAEKSIRRLIDRQLYSAALTAWEQQDFEEATRLLREVSSDSIGTRREHLYVLGVSAAQVGNSRLATGELRKLLNSDIDLSDHPHYEAQAAYMLVKLLPEGQSEKYAELIEKKYRDTIYYNSVVRTHLSNS